MSITDRQKQILECIVDYQSREGFPPSVRELCQKLDLASPGSLLKHLRALENNGFLIRSPGKKRAWKIAGYASPSSSIPLVGRIAAGSPILAEQTNEENLPIDPMFFGSSDAFALRVKGDSMIEAHIQDGDLAIIRPQPTAENGEIVAVIVEGMETEATLKIMRKTGDQLELHPANSGYVPLIFKGSDRSSVKIVGKLIGIIRPKA